MAAIKGPPLYAQNSGTQRKKKHVLAVMLMRNASHISGDNICRPWQNSPMAGRIFGSKSEPIFGSKSGPQNGVQHWITFSFLLLGLCLSSFKSLLGPRFGVRIWTQK